MREPGGRGVAGRFPAGAVAARRIWLCDLDGTLVDSAPAHEAAFRDAIAEFAPDALATFRYAEHAGASTYDVAARLAGNADATARLVRRKQRLYREYVDEGMVTVFPGAHRLLDRLISAGRTAYLVTGGSRGSVERVLAACSLGGYFRDVLTGDESPAAKPDPRFYVTACRRWAVDRAVAVAVEDSGHGVASAVGAGLLTLQVHVAEPVPGAVAVRRLDEIVSLLDSGPEVNGGG